MVNAQEWLDREYPKNGTCQRKDHSDYGKKRNEITGLDISKLYLQGSLKLEGFVNLEHLDVRKNYLTDINSLLVGLNPEKIKTLRLGDNNFSESNLEPFSRFINLKHLSIFSNWWRQDYDKGIANRFYGSLEPLKNLTKLEVLMIENTDIDLGLEYLPLSVTEICCDPPSDRRREGSKSEIIREQLAPFINRRDNENGNIYSYQSWKKEYLKPKWQEKGFSQEEMNQWIQAGLTPEDYIPAVYLRKQNISFEEFKEDFKPYNGDYKLWKVNHECVKSLEKENAQLHSLESEVERLTNLIKEQKDKIIEAYTHFFQEKELLQQLITAHLEYRKAKEGKVKLHRKRENIYNELVEKVSEELMDKVEDILQECEKLVVWEFELQYQIDNNKRLIANSQQTINQITYNITNLNLNQGHALIGNQLGDNANLNYQIEEVLRTQIQIPPRSN